jgi:hypothetical protein
MQHHHALLLHGFHGNKAHGRPAHRLANRLSVGRIVLLAFDVGLHVARRHQPDIVPECAQLACPIVPGGTRLDADPTGLDDRREERQHPRPPQTSPNYHPTVAVDAMHLKNGLCYVQTDNHNLSHRSPPRSSVAAHAAPWVESRPRHHKLNEFPSVKMRFGRDRSLTQCFLSCSSLNWRGSAPLPGAFNSMNPTSAFMRVMA